MKEIIHPDYQIEGTNMFNLSKWSRENVPKPPHAIPLGSVVDLQRDFDESYLNLVEQNGKTIKLGIQGTARLIVVAHHQDCDGTALYEIASEPIASPTETKHRFDYLTRVKLSFHGLTEDQLQPTGDRVSLEPFVSWFSLVLPRQRDADQDDEHHEREKNNSENCQQIVTSRAH